VFFLDHFGITVRHLDTSVRFYSALFDSEPLETVTWRGKDAEYLAELLGQPGVTIDAAFFRIPNSDGIIEIIEYHGLTDGVGVPNRHYQTSGAHLAFYVKSIDAAAERVRSAGAEFLSKPVTIMFGPYKGSGGRSVLFRDPDGVSIQLMEVTHRPGGLPLPGVSM
jgi:catechol 2,3-dioxygenase-like lactoylglutathione lyase family enzyme